MDFKRFKLPKFTVPRFNHVVVKKGKLGSPDGRGDGRGLLLGPSRRLRGSRSIGADFLDGFETGTLGQRQRSRSIPRRLHLP